MNFNSRDRFNNEKPNHFQKNSPHGSIFSAVYHDFVLVDNNEPLTLAEAFIIDRFTDANGVIILRRWRSDFYQYFGGRYVVINDEVLTAVLYNFLERVRYYCKDSITQLKVTANVVKGVIHALPSRGLLIDDLRDQPILLRHGLNIANILPCANGILNLDDLSLLPPSPEFFVTDRVDYPYLPEAPVPTRWLQFLRETWDDPECIAALQEWFGYLLSNDTSLQKILLIVGPKRSGKGTIARLLKGLLGNDHVNGSTLNDLCQQFGLQGLLGKKLMIIPDARLNGQTNRGRMVERLLSISGEDSVNIDRKFKTPLTVKLPTRIILMSNELPNLSDISGALASRFVILTIKNSFYGREDTMLMDKLLAERSGILNWALEGRRRLYERGEFVVPASSNQAERELNRMMSPINAFIEDCCVIGDASTVGVRALFDKWKCWCEENEFHSSSTVQSFSRHLRIALPRIGESRPNGEDGQRYRLLTGITIKVDNDD